MLASFHRATALRWCTLLLGGLRPLAAQGATATPLERFPGVRVELRRITNPRSGLPQRVIVTTPAQARGPRATVFVAGWLSCDPIQMPNGPGNDGFLRLVRAVIERSGMTVVRVEKPGVGGSAGDCAETDFDTELAGYRTAFEAMRSIPPVDTTRIVILGLSNGGGFAPLVAGAHAVRGFVSVSGWARTWAEHMLDLERRRLLLAGTPPEEVTAQMRRWLPFYDAYLDRGRTPRQIEAEIPALRGLWYDEPDHQYGRPARYYQQLQALDLATAWSRVRVPVLVVHGSLDWIMSDEDVAPIAAALPGAAAGSARARRQVIVLRGRGHALRWYPSAADAFHGRNGAVRDDVNDIVVAWLRRLMAAPR